MLALHGGFRVEPFRTGIRFVRVGQVLIHRRARLISRIVHTMPMFATFFDTGIGLPGKYSSLIGIRHASTSAINKPSAFRGV